MTKRVSMSAPAAELSATLKEMLESAYRSPEGVVRAAAFVTGAFSIPTARALIKRGYLVQLDDAEPRPGRAYRLTALGREAAETIFGPT